MTCRFLHLGDDPLDAELVAATLEAECRGLEGQHVRGRTARRGGDS